MANANYGAQVPEASAQAQLFGAESGGPPSPVLHSLYGNGGGRGGGLVRNNESLLELDKALNYEVRVVAGNSNQPYVCGRRRRPRRRGPPAR